MRSPFKKKLDSAGCGHSITTGSAAVVTSIAGRPKMVFPSTAAYWNARQAEQRRRLRIVQVRKMSNEAAAKVREKVRAKQEEEVKRIAQEELQKYIARKEEELANLEAEYQRALADVGLGHEGLRELEEYEAWKQHQKRLHDEVADVRGDHALRVVRYQQAVESKLRLNKNAVRQSVALTERLRAAEMRAKLRPVKYLNKVEVIEINPTSKDFKKVRFVDRDEVVLSNGQAEIKRLDGHVGHGLEAAIAEEEAKARFDEKTRRDMRDMEVAKRRGEEAVRRVLAERRQQEQLQQQQHHQFQRQQQQQHHPDQIDGAERPTFLTDPASQNGDASDSIGSFSDVERRFRTLLSRGSRHEAIGPARPELEDVDMTPVRGPSSSKNDTSSFGTSETTSSTTKTSSTSSTSTQMDTGVAPATDEIDDAGLSWARGLDGFKTPLVKQHVSGGPSIGAKNDDIDRDFVARVLSGLNVDAVDVKIDIEEVSTFASSTSFSTVDEDSMHRLIGGIKKSATSDEIERQQKLRSYIEKLLQMRRQEIADLSVSSTLSTSETSTTTSTSETSMSTLSNSLSGSSSMVTSTPSVSSTSTSSKDTSEGLSKSVSTIDKGSISTPVSILSGSSSSGGSGSRSSLPKTVRFQMSSSKPEEELDGTYLSTAEQMIEEKKREIMEQTRASLEEIGRRYQEQRRIIEAELEKRRQRKLKGSLSSPALMSDEASEPQFSVRRARSVTPSLSESSLVLSSSSQDDRPIQDLDNKENRIPELSEGPLMTSSSSGLSISGSNLSPLSTSQGQPQGEAGRRRVFSSSDLSNLSLSSSTSSKEGRLTVKQIEKLKSEREAKIQEQKKIRKQQLSAFTKPSDSSESNKLSFLLINKSSSSGTSGSTATAEFLARLREMEMPTLRAPTQEQMSEMSQQQQLLMRQISSSGGQNTSADVAKLQDLESSKAS